MKEQVAAVGTDMARIRRPEPFLCVVERFFDMRATAAPSVASGPDREDAMRRFVGMVGGAAALLAGCGGEADLPLAATTGPNPRLPPPENNLLPTVEISPAVGWPGSVRPTPANGLRVAAFAEDLDHPRQLHVLPNGDVLVAESAAPAGSGFGGLKGIAGSLIKEAAGLAVPSADRITLPRDADGDGTPELRTTFLDGLRSPFGMALVSDDLYVANTDAVLRFPYREGATRIDAPGEVVVELPAGPINQHWTRNLLADPDGERLYIAIGSASNIAEHGLEREEGRAAIWEADLATGEARVYASGLRNPVGLAWEPETGALWAAVNERDVLGDDLPPDYITAVREGAFYGWPFSYWGGHVDERVEPQRPELVA